MRVVVTTCKPYYWCLLPFIYLFQNYWSTKQEVVIGGYEPLPMELPPNFSFHSIAPETYPKKKWSKGVLEFMEALPDRHVIWMLEDYWLVRPVNHNAIRTLGGYVENNGKCLRLDLTADRYYAGKVNRPHRLGEENTREFTYGCYDIIPSNPDHYHVSTQAGIWNREKLVELIKAYHKKEGENSGQHFEVHATTVLRNKFPDWQVWGTRQFPVRYTIGIGTGHEGVNTQGIPEEHVTEMRRLGYFDTRN